jgi:hypothetical protein
MPAAAPTELLADVVRDLRESNRQIALDIKGIQTVLVAVQTELRFIRWIGVFFAGILVTLVGGAIWLSWNASALNAEVKQQGGRLEAGEGRLEDLVLGSKGTENTNSRLVISKRQFQLIDELTEIKDAAFRPVLVIPYRHFFVQSPPSINEPPSKARLAGRRFLGTGPGLVLA